MNPLQRWCACGLFTFSAVLGAPPDTLTFLHVSDSHISNQAGYHPRLLALIREKTADITTLQRLLVQKPIEFNADLVVHTGDMVHFYEAEIRDGRQQATQIEQFCALLPLCPVPFYSILGNHDLRSYSVDDEDSSLTVNQWQSQKARAAWSRNLACFYDGFYYHRIYAVGKTRLHLFFLDNSSDLHEDDYLDEMQLNWLQHEMQQTGKEPIIIFMHKYLPALDYNKDRQSFSAATAPVLNDSTCSTGFLQVLNEHPNIQLLLVGHGHSRKSEMIPFPRGHQIAQFAPGAYVKNVNNWRMVKCTVKEIMIFAPGSKEIECRIPHD
jgi:DNA repair exonuclease SbcCD nuclease subunit